MKLYQINLTREEVNRVNRGERNLPVYRAHCDASILGKFPGREFYTRVADIATLDGLDAAFEIGNIGPEEKITRYAPMHSVSVGDVLVREDGRAFIVQSFGFAEVADWVTPLDDDEPSTYKPEAAVLYDGTPGSGSIRRR